MPIIYSPPRLLVPSRRFAPDVLWAVGAQGAQQFNPRFPHASSSGALAQGIAGLEAQADGTNALWSSETVLGTSDGAGGGDFTLLSFCRPSASGTAFALLGQRNESDYAMALLFANMNAGGSNSSGSLCFFTFINPSTSAVASAGAIDGLWHTFVGRRSGTAHSVWRDGTKLDDQSLTARDVATSSQRLAVGGGWNSFLSSWAFPPPLGTPFGISAGWNRAVPDNDLALLGRDPWLLFERPMRRRYWFGAGSTAYNLVVQDATHSHLADSLGLTQANILAIADALHAHAADGVTLSQAATLAVADALHAHSADSVALVQQHVLAVADALHSHLADSPALVQANTLSVASTEHAHAADSPTLTQAITIAVLDCLHSHLVDGVSLTQAATLAVQDTLHAHTVDNLALSGAAILAVADALHGHAADNVALTQAHVLAVADALHAHGVDAVALVQANVLAVQDALHAHAAESPAVTTITMLAVQDAVHAHLADSFGLTQAHLLVVNDALHGHTADGALNLVQAGTLIVSDALHAHIADLITLRMPGLGTATVFVVPHQQSVFLIARETNIFPVRN